MLSSAFDLGEDIKLRTLEYKVSSNLWNRYTLSAVDLAFNNWQTIKYLNDAGDGFNSRINEVPNDRGGLYLFYAQCPIIRGITEYPFYIGRAQLTENQNLRKRVMEYYTKFSRNDERPKITTMFKYWAKDLYLAFIVLDNNNDVVDLEKTLINSLLLPMNDQIPDEEIRQAVKAF
jgi:hypothetical protein